jgi:hypothetical protein
MKTLLLVLLLAARWSDETIVAKEKSMWEMWKQKDAKSFAALLAGDFYDIYLSGKVVGKKELMETFADADLLDYKIGKVDVVRLASDARLLAYRAHVHGRADGKEEEYDVDVTSVWAIRNGQWKSVFYRENLVPSGTKPSNPFGQPSG